MPCYLFTYHGYGTWLPDHPRGYVRRKEGILPTDKHMAECYQKNLRNQAVHFDPDLQQLLVEAILATRPFLNLRFYAIASEESHIHALLSWDSEKNYEKISNAIKTRLTRELNQRKERKRWLSKGGDCRRVRDRRHFDYLLGTYLPRHRGVFWRSGDL